MIENLSGSSGKIYISFSNKKIEVIAWYDNKGNICFDVNYNNSKLEVLNKIFLILCFVIEIYFIINFEFIIYFIYIFAIIKFLKSLIKLYDTSGRCLKNHGAEHMLINAYNKLKRIPTLEEAKIFSRFSFNCGSRKYIANFICILFLFIFNFKFPYFSLRMIISNLKIIKLISIPIQFFLTRYPDDYSLLLAIAALTKLEEIVND